MVVVKSSACSPSYPSLNPDEVFNLFERTKINKKRLEMAHKESLSQQEYDFVKLC